MKIKLLSLLMCSICSMSAYAKAEPETDYDFFKKREAGGFLTVGLSSFYQGGIYKDHKTYLHAHINAAYYFENGLFVEHPGHSNKFNASFSAGYNLFNTPNWEFDLMVSTAHGDLNFYAGADSFEKRSTSYLGLRASGEVAGIQVQAVLAPATKNKDNSGGSYASLSLAKDWQYKNWRFYGSVGAQYRSEKMLDYYYGVPQSAQSFKAYNAKGGANLITKFGFSKPLLEDWLLEGNISYTKYTNSIINSPYTQFILQRNTDRKDYGSHVGLSLSYVF
ncbi:MipA/OmpV family protein [Pseudoalteromonas holothuriae]|nr:MipA/OmpV family protein [Pseudoalteromonas sp. CIP111951]